MIGLALAAAVTTSLAAAAAEAPAPQAAAFQPVETCLVFAEGPKDSSMQLRFSRTSDRQMVEGTVVYAPPMLQSERDMVQLRDHPALTFTYDLPASGGLGQPTKVDLVVYSSGMQKTLDEATAALALDGAANWSTDLDYAGGRGNWNSYRGAPLEVTTTAASSPQRVTTLGDARTGEVTLKSASGDRLGYSRYDLAAVNVRNQLFAEVLAEASKPTSLSHICSKVRGDGKLSRLR